MSDSDSLPPVRSEDRQGAAPGRRWRHYLTREPAAEEPRLDLEQVSAALRRRWRILAAGLAGVLAVALLAGLLLPERYTATATFLVEGTGPGGAESGEALAVLQRVGRGRTTETEIELLQGRRVIEPVVDSLDLHVRFVPSGHGRSAAETFPRFVAGPEARPGVYRLRTSDGELEVRGREGTGVARAAGGGTVAFGGIELTVPDLPEEAEGRLEVLPFSEAVDDTRERIGAERARLRANLVRLRCDGRTADAAHRLCGAVASSYLRLRSELQHAEASAAADFLDDQVRDVRARLTAAEESLRAYEERTGSVALEERASEAVRQHASLRAQREQLEAERGALASLIEEIEGEQVGLTSYRRLASFPTFLRSRDNVVSRLVESLVELENRRSELAVKRTGQDPELAALDARIRDIEGQLLSVARSYETSLAAQVRSLDETLASQGRQMAEIPERQVESARLERRVTMLEDLYRFLQTRLQEARVARAVELPSVRVVDRANRPYEPSFPDLALFLAVGAVLGLGTGLAGAIWREHTDHSVRVPEELEEAGIPVLSLVPRLSSGRAMPRVGSRPNGDRRVLVPPAGGGDAGEEAVAGEAFRDLALELESARRRWGGGLRSVAVTSSGRGEGKTSCACNLAVQSALLGEEVLLMDADLRGKGVARWLDLSRGTEGLQEILARTVRPESCIQRVPVDDSAALDVLPSGGNGAGRDRIDPEEFRRLLRAAPSVYDLIVVDTAPLSVPGGAAQIALGVDAMVMVVRAGMTEREGLERGLRRIDRASGEVLGVVLNDLRVSDHYLGTYGDDDA